MQSLAYTALSLVALLATSASAAAPSAGGKYTISPGSFPDYCIAPEYDHNGALLVLKQCDTNSDIVWEYVGGTSFRNTQANKCVDVRDGAGWNGNRLQVWDCYTWNSNQQYILPNQQIQWAGQNFCWDLTNGAGATGTQIQIWNCFDYNHNQMWNFVDAEEIDDCEDGSSSTTPSSSASSAVVSPSASVTGTVSAGASVSASANATASLSVVAEASNASAIGDAFFAGGGSSSTKSNKHHSASATASASASASHASSASASAAASASASAGSSSSGSWGGDASSILKTSGTKIVDASGKQVILKGTNIGGWLVFEDWMCGITDYSGNADRFPQWTLESRFGESQTKELMNVWMDNWFVAADWDRLKSLGFTVVRLPFSYRNFQNMDGSWSDDGFTRLDWAFTQAKRVGIYVIPVFHIWDTQKERYSMISEDNSDGQASRQRAGAMWQKIAGRYANEPIIAAWDLINEPTGSANDNLQQDLYNAVRAVDKNHILIQASLNTNPAQYGWTNVVYTMHEYLMMGSDYNSNVGAYANGPAASINSWNAYNIPTYVGEFMADGQTLNYMLGQLNQASVWWSSWTLHTVQMDRWGLWNYGTGMSVDVSNDSYDSIKNKWSNMGGLTRQAIADQYQTYANQSWKRSEVNVEARAVASPRVGSEGLKRRSAHGGRSRRALAHGGVASSF